jgi:predicted O-methyltransferase YrrM
MTSSLSYWKTVTPDELFHAIGDVENRRFVRRVLDALSMDPVWTHQILDLIAADGIEIRCSLAWLAREMQPTTYLEIGVRRGFSMAMVAARCTKVNIYGFDRWIPGYGGVDNPGPVFVRKELCRVGHSGAVHFIGGNSHSMLPAFFGTRRASPLLRLWVKAKYRRRPTQFDLITIDGDHSLLGAYRDLVDTMPLCAVGGAVVFDDIAADLSTLDPKSIRAERGEDPHAWRDLLGVWRAAQRRFPNFRYFEYVTIPPGVGLAVRLW